jgi:hypothetical protein
MISDVHTQLYAAKYPTLKGPVAEIHRVAKEEALTQGTGRFILPCNQLSQAA